MAGVAGTITLSQAAQWANQQGALLQISDWTKPLKQSAFAIANHTKKSFASSSSPDGTPWAPIVFRVRGAGKPLRDTGRLMASVTGKAAGHTESITKNSLIYGTNVQYAGIHQHGGTITAKKKFLAIPLTVEAMRAGSPRNMTGLFFRAARNNSGVLSENRGSSIVNHYLLKRSVRIPARPFLGFSNAAIKDITDIFTDFVLKQIKPPGK